MNMESEGGSGGGGGVVVRGRVEIDMRQPFRSVKEAVSLFGEKVLAGELYAHQLKEMQKKGNSEENHRSKRETVTAELQETKQCLQKPNEEGNLMAYYLHSLKKELEETKKELQQLKNSREFDHHHQYKVPPPIDQQIEELKFIENPTATVEAKTPTRDGFRFEKKRSVKFASPPSLTRVIVNKDASETSHTVSEKKSKRKPLIPLLGLLFPKKKGNPKSAGSPWAESPLGLNF